MVYSNLDDSGRWVFGVLVDVTYERKLIVLCAKAKPIWLFFFVFWCRWPEKENPILILLVLYLTYEVTLPLKTVCHSNLWFYWPLSFEKRQNQSSINDERRGLLIKAKLMLKLIRCKIINQLFDVAEKTNRSCLTFFWFSQMLLLMCLKFLYN